LFKDEELVKRFQLSQNARPKERSGSRLSSFLCPQLGLESSGTLLEPRRFCSSPLSLGVSSNRLCFWEALHLSAG